MTRAASQTRNRELTLEEYLKTPVTKQRQEVIDGVIVILPTPTVGHQLILGNLYSPLRDFVARHGLGTVVMAPSDILITKIPKLRVRQPDLYLIRHERASPAEWKEAHVVEIAPDFAVEILSPSENIARRTEKFADYASIGVPELWLIDPKTQSVEVHTLADGRYSLARRFEKEEEVRSDLFPGLALAVRSIFE